MFVVLLLLSTPNPNITWEVSETTDMGLEAGFLKKQANFRGGCLQDQNHKYPGKRQASIPDYTGLVLPDENIGKMDSKGFEVQAGYRQISDRLNLSVNGNFSYTENKIIYFDETPQSEPYQKRKASHWFRSCV